MDNENIAISNENLLYSQVIEDTETLEAKLIICSFDPNGNDVTLNRKTISNWIDTLVNQPLLGKIGVSDAGDCDFEGHNFYVVQRVSENGNLYQDSRFDTSAMGVFTDVAIENIRGKDYIIATAKLWKRFPEFCAVVKRRLAEGSLSTSWEIAVKKSHTEMINGRKIKVIDEGCFIGHTLLGQKITPAYKESQVLEVASNNEDNIQDLIVAINNDIANIKPEKEEEILNKPTQTEVTEPVIEATVVSQEGKPTESAALTEFDLRVALRQAIAEKLNKDRWDICITYHFPVEKIVWVQLWDAESELDVITFTYSVENDVVTVSEPVESKLTVSVAQINSTIEELQTKLNVQNEALIQSSVAIEGMKTQLSDLAPFKEKFEKSEQDRIEKELSEQRETLKSYALKSGYISEEDILSSETIKNLIENVDEAGIKTIIAEKFMESLEVTTTEVSSQTTETQETEVAQIKANISNTEETSVDYLAAMKSFLNK